MEWGCPLLSASSRSWGLKAGEELLGCFDILFSEANT